MVVSNSFLFLYTKTWGKIPWYFDVFFFPNHFFELKEISDLQQSDVFQGDARAEELRAEGSLKVTIRGSKCKDRWQNTISVISPRSCCFFSKNTQEVSTFFEKMHHIVAKLCLSYQRRCAIDLQAAQRLEDSEATFFENICICIYIYIHININTYTNPWLWGCWSEVGWKWRSGYCWIQINQPSRRR